MKVFSSYLFRAVLFLTLFFSSAFCPLFIVLPKLTTTSGRFTLGAVVILLAIIESIGYIFLEIKMTFTPIKTVSATAKKLCGGEYGSKTEIRHADREVKQLGKSINDVADEFENLEQMRKSFVANASHELRSPLTSMQGFLQAILDGTVDENEREKYLKIVLNETKRLNTLITSMLDLSRMDSGKYPPVMSRFEINAVIRQVVERFEPNLVKKELQLDVDFARPVSFVFADKDKIMQVLINLIDNAIKYSPAYSRILVTTHIRGKKIYVSVKDQGFGISKKDQMLIWDRFYMSDKARTPNKSKGTGLGLSIVKKIMDDHGEAITVESNKGAGATFIFSLTLFDSSKHRQSAEIKKYSSNRE